VKRTLIGLMRCMITGVSLSARVKVELQTSINRL
jgi:hypothetical protein